MMFFDVGSRVMTLEAHAEPDDQGGDGEEDKNACGRREALLSQYLGTQPAQPNSRTAGGTKIRRGRKEAGRMR